MTKYENLIDIYESWDLDSLIDEAYHLSCAVRDDIARIPNVQDPLCAALMVGVYFMDADGRVDGDEDTLYRRLFEGAPFHQSGFHWFNAYKKYNWEPWVINYLRNCSSSALEHAVRLGIVICAADGFISESERERILYLE